MIVVIYLELRMKPIGCWRILVGWSFMIFIVQRHMRETIIMHQECTLTKWIIKKCLLGTHHIHVLATRYINMGIVVLQTTDKIG